MNERKCRDLVYARSEGRCEMCGAVAHEVHHRKNRSQGGRWTPANCLHLCVFDHRWCTVNPTEAVRNGWSIRSYQDPTTSPVWLRALEWAWLDDEGAIHTQPEDEDVIA